MEGTKDEDGRLTVSVLALMGDTYFNFTIESAQIITLNLQTHNLMVSRHTTSR